MLLPVFMEIKQALFDALVGAELDVEAADEAMAKLDQMEEPPQDGPAGRGQYSPDFDQWENWTAAEWERFRGYQDKVMAAAKAGLGALSLPISTLETIRENMPRLPLERRVTLAVWAADLVDEIHDRTEAAVFDISRDSLYTREGRECQKRMRDQENKKT